MALPLTFDQIISGSFLPFVEEGGDWLYWRLAYKGGRTFRSTFLKKFDDRETPADFLRRTDVTPIPTYAKREINKIRNSLFTRFAEIQRTGGSKRYREAVAGIGLGVDNRGSSMNAFLGTEVLEDLLVIGKIGVLVDAPKFEAYSAADIPADFKPYIYTYPIEQIHSLTERGEGQPGEYSSVLLRDCYYAENAETKKNEKQERYRYYYLGPDGYVRLQYMTKDKKPDGEVETLQLTEIPFVLFDIKASLMEDVWSHQVALLNLISSDTSYALEANFPFLTKQKGSLHDDSHLKDGTKSMEVGVKKGTYYDRGAERPGFISPSTEPMRASLELRKELKKEVSELVSGALADLGANASGGDGSMDAGLAFIGLVLQKGENRIADHWASYESTDSARRLVATIAYPDTWQVKSDVDRIEEADKLSALMFKVPGRKVKKEIAKQVATKLLRGIVPTKTLAEIYKEIDEAAYCTSDPTVILEGIAEGAVSTETATLALGFDENEAAKAKQDQADRAKDIATAQADAAAARGMPGGSVDPKGSAEAEKATREKDKLGGRGTGKRGKSRN